MKQNEGNEMKRCEMLANGTDLTDLEACDVRLFLADHNLVSHFLLRLKIRMKVMRPSDIEAEARAEAQAEAGVEASQRAEDESEIVPPPDAPVIKGDDQVIIRAFGQSTAIGKLEEVLRARVKVCIPSPPSPA